MFEDIGKKDNVTNIITQIRALTNYIYNHGWLLTQMREFCGREIVHPGATRFATNYLCLNSLLKKKFNLKQLFTSDVWAKNQFSTTPLEKKIEQQVLEYRFWNQVAHVVVIYKPLYKVLRLVNIEVVPTMLFVYEFIHIMKNSIQQQRVVQWVLQIINDRWYRTLSHPFHVAGIIF